MSGPPSEAPRPGRKATALIPGVCFLCSSGHPLEGHPAPCPEAASEQASGRGEAFQLSPERGGGPSAPAEPRDAHGPAAGGLRAHERL